MAIIFKCAASGVFCAAVCMLLRRSNPEFAFALGALTAAILLLLSLRAAGELLGQLSEGLRLPPKAMTYLEPMLKCLGVSLTTAYSSSLCRDAAQTALASALETVGTVCAAMLALPGIISVLNIIGELL